MRTKTINIDTGTASIRLRIAEGEGTPLLFFHGGPGGTDYLFKFFAVRVAKAGYRPVGMIQRGCPGSPSDGPFTVEASLDDFECVRKTLETDRLALLGHSYGGFLAAAYAAMNPSRIERLILVCPSGARPGWRRDFESEIYRRLSDEEKCEYDRLTREAENAPYEKRAELLSNRAHLTIFSYYSPHHRREQPGLANLTWKVHEELRNSAEEWCATPAWEHGLERLTCPSAILYGEDDVVPITVPGEYAEILPHPLVIGLEKCGHFPWMEEADAFWTAFDEAIKYQG